MLISISGLRKCPAFEDWYVDWGMVVGQAPAPSPPMPGGLDLVCGTRAGAWVGALARLPLHLPEWPQGGLETKIALISDLRYRLLAAAANRYQFEHRLVRLEIELLNSSLPYLLEWPRARQ